MTAAGERIAQEIREHGPIQFSRFMEIALYHPEFGYYRRKQPFGSAGDFFTAEQLQPVFGRLIAAYVRQAMTEYGISGNTVVELGAGRSEMAEAFAGFIYIPIDISYGHFPKQMTGAVFSNEFFDAVPVDVIQTASGGAIERRVGVEGGRFIWTENPSVSLHTQDGAGTLRELQTHRLAWLQRIDGFLEEGLVITIDYGYTHPELPRFPQGTLMSYRLHRATSDVLAAPGEQDITAHVDFTALQEEGARLGWETVRYHSLADALLQVGEADEFASAIEGASEAERLRHKLQLKTLLFGMGETFRILVQRKAGRNKNGPE